MARWILTILSGVVIIPAAIVGYVGYQALRMPSGNPVDFKRTPKQDVEGSKLIACVGDSMTHGHIGHSWVSDLRQAYPGHTVINAGINGNLAWNVDQRLDEILDLRPDIVLLLVGSNDVMGTFSEEDGHTYIMDQGLPQLPSRQFFRDNYRSILTRLGRLSDLQYAVISLPPLGEQSNSDINQLVDEFNNDIRSISTDTDTQILDLNQGIWGLINSHGENNGGNNGARNLPSSEGKEEFEPKSRDSGSDYKPGIPRLVTMCSAIFRHYFLGETWDQIGEHSGLVATCDFIHLNERAAGVMLELVRHSLHSMFHLEQ